MNLESVGSQTLLGKLPPEFTGRLHGERTVTLAKGETLFERGDAGDGCYWLRKGVVTVCATSITTSPETTPAPKGPRL